ncbi:type III-B CRISPR module RAMP protein Cmr4 [Saccharolobus caldissimus]|uniref:Type III-B CRISPR module RAMP protein Cmr4 n=1 Tax=Saccharolobus caldissimus TaxID=1702097 RepID=A0AAQ4CSB7_9CREN|nr:type III-B CRISPR module RAMP protein Cmr4 [Saccharolobus caldissimus]BDB98698.1 type III-B CRISPR module RAMP protein Cmr4 [Saccharolobus caldissimus]
MDSLFLFIYSLTPVHAGIGRQIDEYVDIPVQRDEFDIPVIWSSSIRGSLGNNFPNLKKLLGIRDNKSFSESEISVLDARLFLIPARTLYGIWIYVTSPHLLTYYSIYNEILNKNSPITINPIPLTTNDKTIIFENDKAYINEILFDKVKVEESLKNLFNLLPEELIKKDLPKTSVFVTDDSVVRDVINRSLIIQYRVKLKENEKSIDEGPWTEEFIPMFTIFVSGIICKSNCEAVKETINGKSIIIGGKESLGKSLVKLYVK